MILYKGENCQVISIGATGIPVGLFCNSEYVVENFLLEKGDTLLLYTDGLTEAMNYGVGYGDE
jgi:sigma-B regulation protein RsbU (phosphoserine phosphatase)